MFLLGCFDNCKFQKFGDQAVVLAARAMAEEIFQALCSSCPAAAVKQAIDNGTGLFWYEGQNVELACENFSPLLKSLFSLGKQLLPREAQKAVARLDTLHCGKLLDGHERTVRNQTQGLLHVLAFINHRRRNMKDGSRIRDSIRELVNCSRDAPEACTARTPTPSRKLSLGTESSCSQISPASKYDPDAVMKAFGGVLTAHSSTSEAEMQQTPRWFASTSGSTPTMPRVLWSGSWILGGSRHDQGRAEPSLQRVRVIKAKKPLRACALACQCGGVPGPTCKQPLIVEFSATKFTDDFLDRANRAQARVQKEGLMNVSIKKLLLQIYRRCDLDFHNFLQEYKQKYGKLKQIYIYI